ncbi:MAG: AraC family transcriptional regulator [Granulosicoccus sp.]
MSNATKTQTDGFEPERCLTIGGYQISLLPRNAYEVAYLPEKDVIGFAFETQNGFHAFSGDVIRPFRTRPNSLSWLSAGCEVWSKSSEGGEYLTVSLNIDQHENKPMQERFNDCLDEKALNAAHAIRRQLLTGCVDELLIEQYIMALESSVLRVLGPESIEPSASRWLTSSRLRRLDEYIETHLGGRLTVAELAASCGLSAGFLNRAMRAATGRSSHEYVLDRRVGRARQLLCSSGLSVMQIALECGFSSHSHLTATMRGRLGITPALLRGPRKRVGIE